MKCGGGAEAAALAAMSSTARVAMAAQMLASRSRLRRGAGRRRAATVIETGVGTEIAGAIETVGAIGGATGTATGRGIEARLRLRERVSIKRKSHSSELAHLALLDLQYGCYSGWRQACAQIEKAPSLTVLMVASSIPVAIEKTVNSPPMMAQMFVRKW